MIKIFQKTLFCPSLLACVVPALTLRRSAKPGSAKPLSHRDSYNEIDAYVEREMLRLNIPGVSLAIVQDDKVAHLRGFGRVRPGDQVPTPQTPFMIGSLTKSFTALAVMQLVEAGKIEPDAPVQRYLPWFRVADARTSAQITVRHLLNQTGGLPGSSGEIILADFDNRPNAAEHQARALSTLVLTRPVGSAFEYSNSNYQLLGLIIESVSGESYADYVRQHILGPLDMCHTYTSKVIAKRNGLAIGHQYWFMRPVPAPNTPIPYGSLPASLLVSCAQDLAQYMISLLNRGRYGSAQILSGAGIDEMQRGVREVHVMGQVFGQYGMGWFVDKIGKTKLVWHSGTLPDFASHMALVPEQKKGVVLLFNACHHWMNPVLAEIGTGVAALLAGEPPPSRPFGSIIPLMLRAQLLLPAFQIASVAATARLLRRAQLAPERYPGGRRKRALQILLAAVPNLLGAATLIPMLGKRRGYLMLYMPDYSLTALVCGSLALAWSFFCLRPILSTLRAFRKR